MSGPAGCGKSTWVREHAAWGDFVLSRDEFREHLRTKLNKPNEYFPCEAKEEWKYWTDHIIECMKAGPGTDVWIDQTTITQGALDKLLLALSPYCTEKDIVQVVVMNVPIERIREQNAMREGFARVPDDVIVSMVESAAKNPITQDRTRYKFPDLHIFIYPVNAQG